MKTAWLFSILFFSVALDAQIGFPGQFFTLDLLNGKIRDSLYSRNPESIKNAAAEFKIGFEKNYNETAQSLGLHKHDSIHMQWWDNDSMAWIVNEFESWIINYDCNAGKVVNELFLHPYFPIEHDSTRIVYEYYGTGGLKSVTYSWTPPPASIWLDRLYLHYLPSGNIDEAWFYAGATSDNTIRITYEYNQHGQVFTEKVFNWSVGQSDWYMTERYTYFYDSEPKLLLKLKKINNGSTNIWKEVERWHYHYDNDNQPDTILYQIKSITNTTWNNKSRTVYTYTTNGLPHIIDTEEYIGAQWLPKSRTVYTYTTNGLPHIIDTEEYIGAQWLPKSRQTKEYDANDRVLEVLYQSYEAPNWQNDSLWTLSYYPNNEVNQFQYSFWDPLQDNWLVLRDDSLDADGKLLVRVSPQYEFGWGVIANFRWQWSWMNHQIKSLKADYQNLMDSTYWMPWYQYVMEFDNEGLITRFTRQEWADTAYIDIFRTDYFNSTCPVNGALVTTTDLPFDCSFANPGTNGQLIVCDELPSNSHLTAFLYDPMGRLVHQQPLQNHSFSLDTPAANGLYFLVVRDKTKPLLRKKIVLGRQE